MAISAGCNRKVVPESCSSCANRRFGRTLACPCFKAGEHREKSRYQRQRAGKHRNARCSKPANLLNVASKRWNRVHSSTSTGPRPPIWRSHGVWRVIPIFLLNSPHSACDLRRGSAGVTPQTRDYQPKLPKPSFFASPPTSLPHASEALVRSTHPPDLC
jgi:hypothetical protein